ncbi:uncharacterized protein LOC111323273 [Stylophora pistillata]|uniref:uncharacterized protein LOC111323273 n=1 Tax=Stylophora pistillata TaxID=50429 RepID=UPI000C03AAFD|nr:uncharacterized protein LOC111323273 [Stylophora pistillata]
MDITVLYCDSKTVLQEVVAEARAEIRKQRRQTFSGFAVKEEITCGDAQNRSSTLLSRKSFSPEDANSSSLSAHKKGVFKTVTFKDVVETHQQLLCERKSKSKNGIVVVSHETSKQRSAPVESCKPDDNDNKIIQIGVGSNNVLGYETDNQWVALSSDDNALHDNAALPENSRVASEHKDFSKSKDNQGHTLRTAACSGLNKDVVQIPLGNNENSKSVKDISFANNGKVSEVVESLSIGTVTVVNSESINNEVIQKCLPKVEASGKATEAPEKKDTFHFSSVCESVNSSPENRHWMHLFEEEFPRRSRRLQSTPSFGKQSVISEGCNYIQSKNTKSNRSKHCRQRKVTTLQNKTKTAKCSAEHTSVTLNDNLHECIPKDFVFPRPNLDEAKPGGPLGIVVDFSLPDKEFAKLKLAKIKGALPAERINRDVNDKITEKVKEHDTVLKREKDLPELNEQVQESCANKLINPLEGCSMQFDSTIKPDKVETVTILDTSEGKNINQVPQFISKSGNLESERNSEGSVNQFLSSPKHKCDLQFKHGPMKNSEVDFSTRGASQENPRTVVQPCVPHQVDENSVCVRNIVDETSSVAHSAHDGVDEKTDFAFDSCDKSKKEDNNRALDFNGGASDKKFLLQYGHAGPESSKEISTDVQPNCASNCPEKCGLKETSAGKMLLEANMVIHKSRGVLLSSEEQILGSSYPEPGVGEQATPHGKMTEPVESSQISCMTPPEDQSELTPMLMMACLQHHMEGESNVIRSVSLSSYEPVSEKDETVTKMKRDVLAVCLAHLVVIWTVAPGLQWTVLHKWSLPSGGGQEFASVEIVPMNSHVVLLVGGNFCGSNGRILGYSDEGDYSLDLNGDDALNSNHLFSTMCLLNDFSGKTNVEFVIGNRTPHGTALTKWTLDSFGLVVEQKQCFTPIVAESDLTSIQTVLGSHCLLLGTTNDELFLWNHKTCQQLRTISLRTQGLGHLFCLKASTERGLIFLMMANRSGKEIQCEERNCSFLSLALNPKTSKMVCLESIFPVEGFHAIGTNGQYIATGCQVIGEVNLWNITNSRRLASMQVFQDKVSCIGFHESRPVVAFGSASGCVHLFSLC